MASVRTRTFDCPWVLSSQYTGIAIPTLQGALVQTVHVQVSTSDTFDNTNLGVQPNLQYLSAMRDSIDDYRKMVHAVTENTVSARLSNNQSHTWPPSRSNLTMASSESSTESQDSTGASFLASPFFTSSFPVGTDTGQSRVYALRLNSSLQCDSIEQPEFPASCGGSMPFETAYSNVDSSGSSLDSYSCSLFTFRLCFPSENTSSWYGTNLRQDVTEQFFLDFQYIHETSEDDAGDPWPAINPLTNFTRRCRSNTTLGYFELPNNWNNHSAGPLYEGCSNATLSCPELDVSMDENGLATSPSPFITSIFAIFGDDTFFKTLSVAKDTSDDFHELCSQLRQPFTGLTPGISNTSLWDPARPLENCDLLDYRPGMLARSLYDWLINFRSLDSITAALSFTMSLSNKAILNQDVTEFVGNDIYNPLGYGIMKPSMSPAAMIFLSFLISIQLIGLVSLALYAHSRPRWTESLDSFALIRLGAAMADDLPLVSAIEAFELTVLDETHGWVGDSGGSEEFRTLKIGGPEPLKEKERYRMIKAGSTLRMRAWDYDGLRRKSVIDVIGG